MKVAITVKQSTTRGRVVTSFVFVDSSLGIAEEFFLGPMLPIEWTALRTVLGSGAVHAQDRGVEVKLVEDIEVA